MYVYTYVFKYVYKYIYLCIHIYIYTSAPTRLERGNANLFRCADLEKSADFNLRNCADLNLSFLFATLKKCAGFNLTFYFTYLHPIPRRWLRSDRRPSRAVRTPPRWTLPHDPRRGDTAYMFDHAKSIHHS